MKPEELLISLPIHVGVKMLYKKNEVIGMICDYKWIVIANYYLSEKLEKSLTTSERKEIRDYAEQEAQQFIDLYRKRCPVEILDELHEIGELEKLIAKAKELKS